MSQNPQKRTKGRALPPDPNKSLFKFKLTWLPDADGNQKKTETWYSYDYPTEREIFPEGIANMLRKQWKSFTALCWKHEDLYEWIKWMRPHTDHNDHLFLYLPNWPEIIEPLQVMDTKYGHSVIQHYANTCGFNDFSFMTAPRSHPRQPGNSPGRVDFRQYYGFKYIHRNDFIVTNLATGKLVKVDVYDNLMYHSENYLHTLHGRVPTLNNNLPETVPAVRGGIPTALNQIITNSYPK